MGVCITLVIKEHTNQDGRVPCTVQIPNIIVCFILDEILRFLD